MGVSTLVGAVVLGIMPFLIVLDITTVARTMDFMISGMATLGVSVVRLPYTQIDVV